MLVNRLHIFLTLAAAAVGVSAQNGTSGLDTCILNCLTIAEAHSTCASYTNVSCVCTSKAFQTAASSCLGANCTTADQEAATQLQKTQCANVSTSASPSATNSESSGNTTRASSTASVSAASSSASKASSGAAPVEQLPFLRAIIAIAGAALGGALVL